MAGKRIIITIDGPSGSGKSTISRMTAARLNFTYLDTGAMYRAVGLQITRTGIDENDATALTQLLDSLDLRLVPGGEDTLVSLGQEDISAAIRTPAMGMVASRVSALPLVRAKLTDLQREIGRQGSLVAEGRDMGTVVFPKADLKFFLDATPEERARRRTEQLRQKGQPADYNAILAQTIKRDQDDSRRQLAPLKPAADAIIIDSTRMTIAEVVNFMIEKEQAH